MDATPTPTPTPTPAETPAPPSAPTSAPTSAATAGADEVAAAWRDPALAQVVYHDWESRTYDDKWSISFDQRCIDFAAHRFLAALGPAAAAAMRPFGPTLEIGAGTGFFSLNLRQAGWLDEVVLTDISPGMVEVAEANARSIGFEVPGRVRSQVAGIEQLPFEDGRFDLVIGHAVLHHIPDVEAGLRECLRVLRPGGRLVFAGEPSRIGDAYARRLGRWTWQATTRLTALAPLRERWARPPEELAESSRAAALEAVVDLHTFSPGDLARTALRAGAVDVATGGAELVAALLGWPVRTFEAAVNPERLGWDWAMFAYRTWQRAGAVDAVLARVLPADLFYNVSVTGVRA